MRMSKVVVRTLSMTAAAGALVGTALLPGSAHASPGHPGDGYCTASVAAPVYRKTDFARIYTIPAGNRMRVHKFVQAADGSSWAWGHGYQKPDGWTNAKNFGVCVIA